MPRERFRPTVEGLDGRVVPTATGFPSGLMPGFLSSTVTHHALSGSGAGAFASHRSLPDSGTSYELSGAANVTKLGMVTLHGTLHSLGNIQSGQATGTITFVNQFGTLTIQLTGPTQGSFAPLPYHFQYDILGGTGSYQNIRGSGTIDVRLFPGPTATTGAFRVFIQ